MKRLLFSACWIPFSVFAMLGCGGHEGGVVDVPLNENPYQVSEQEQRAMNSGVVDTAALTDEEIAALEEEKKKAAEQEQLNQ